MNEFERKERKMIEALLGTVPVWPEEPEWKDGSQIIEPTITKAHCSYCSKKGWNNRIRNRSKWGTYGITKKQSKQFAEIGKFTLPPDPSLKEYIIIANFCFVCEDEDNQNKIEKKAYLMDSSKFRSEFSK